MEVGNTEHGAGTEGPGVSGIKLQDLGKAGGIEVIGLVVIKTQGWKREEGRREGRGPWRWLRPQTSCLVLGQALLLGVQSESGNHTASGSYKHQMRRITPPHCPEALGSCEVLFS